MKPNMAVYVLIAAIIAIVVMAILIQAGQHVSTVFSAINSNLHTD